jgi:2-hydroxy-4-carboxymuconate semialdehyde hemiacetal dehydrogenase
MTSARSQSSACVGRTRRFTGTYIARNDNLVTDHRWPVGLSGVDVTCHTVEGRNREFTAAILEGREPESSIAAVLSSYRVLVDPHSSIE